MLLIDDKRKVLKLLSPNLVNLCTLLNNGYVGTSIMIDISVVFPIN